METKVNSEDDFSENNSSTPENSAKTRLARRRDVAPDEVKPTTPPTPRGTNAERGKSGLRPVALPEMIKLAEAILDSGATPSVVKKMRKEGALGSATPNADGTGWTGIKILADLGKDPEMVTRVLGHEIGHASSMFGGTGKQKSFATKIKNAAHTFKRWIEDNPDAEMLTQKDYDRIRREIKKSLESNDDAWIDTVITEETPYDPEDILAVWNSVEQSLDNDTLYDWIKGLDTAQKKAIVKAAMAGNVPDDAPKKNSRYIHKNTRPRYSLAKTPSVFIGSWKRMTVSGLRRKKCAGASRYLRRWLEKIRG